MRKWMKRIMLQLRASAPKLRALWGKYGYAISMVLLLALVGTAASVYRGAGRGVSDAPEPTAAPTQEAVDAAQMRVEPEQPEWIAPVDGEVVVPYSPDAPVWNPTLGQWQTHAGVDIAAPLGASVVACAQGTVSQAGFDALLGNCVRIEHADGLQSVYGSLQNLEMVEVGKRVQAGEVIGAVGDSAAAEAHLGAHLHFALMRDGESQPPLAQQDGETDARSDAQ